MQSINDVGAQTCRVSYVSPSLIHHVNVMLTLYSFTNTKFSKPWKLTFIYPATMQWSDLYKAFLVEAKWFTSGQMPKADEYLRNGVISTGIHIVLVHTFFLRGHGITRESTEHLGNIQGLISCPATIFLWDDLGNAKVQRLVPVIS